MTVEKTMMKTRAAAAADRNRSKRVTECTSLVKTADNSSTNTTTLCTLPDELILHIVSFLDNPSWANLAFAWKRFLVDLAQTLDPNNTVRQCLQLACTRQAYFNALMRCRLLQNAPKKEQNLMYEFMRDYNKQPCREELLRFFEASFIVNMHWVALAPAEFFVACDKFFMLDSYRRHWITPVVQVRLGTRADLLEHLLDHVAPLLQGRLSSDNPNFEFELSSSGCQMDGEPANHLLWHNCSSDKRLSLGEFVRHVIECLQKQHRSTISASSPKVLFPLTSLSLWRDIDSKALDDLAAALHPHVSGGGVIRELTALFKTGEQLPSFSRLMDALIAMNSVTQLEVDFSDSDDGSVFFSELMRFVEQSSTIDSLVCGTDGLIAADNVRFAQALQQNRSLSSFHFSQHAFCEEYGASMYNILSRNLARNLKNLDVPKGSSEEDLCILMKALHQNNHITELSVVTGSASFAALTAMLRINTAIKDLFVVDNRRIRAPKGKWKSVPCVGDLFDAMCENQTLEQVEASCFRCGQTGMQALARMLRGNSTLWELEISSLIYDGSEDPREVQQVLQSRENKSLKEFCWKFGEDDYV